MAILSCTLLTDEGGLNWPGVDQRQYIAKYVVIGDSASDGYLAVLNGAASVGPDNLPAYGAAYALFGESDNGAFLLNFTMRRALADADFKWHVSTIYRRRQQGDPKPGEFGIRPTLRTTDYWVEFRARQIIMQRARLITDLTSSPAGRPANSAVETFINSIGDEFDEPPTDTKVLPVFVARHYFDTYGEIIDVGRTFLGAQNDAAVTWGGKSYPLRTLKMIDLRTGPSQTDDTGADYYEALFLFENDPNEFKFSLVNRGYRWWDAAEQKKRTDDPVTHEEINYPRLLELDGTLTPENTLGNVIEYSEDVLADYSTLPFD